MKRSLTTLSILVLVSIAVAGAITIRSRLAQNSSSDSRQAAQAATEKVAFKVEGMTCGGCALGVKKTLEKQNGVRKAEVFLEKGQAVAEVEKGKVNSEALAAAVTRIGYATTVIQDK
jgi:copper chaperone CopZ